MSVEEIEQGQCADSASDEFVFEKFYRDKTLKEHIEYQFKRAPWWLIALIIHSLVIGILTQITFVDSSPRTETVIVQTEIVEETPKEEQKDILKEILEEKVVEVDSEVTAPDIDDPTPNPEVEVENVSIADISNDIADLGAISEIGLGDVGSIGGAGDSGALGGMLGNGSGAGGLGKGSRVRYMGTESKGRHFAFLIDYSLSMSIDQLDVAKYELKKAINSFDPKAKVALIFYSGPAWVPDYNDGDIAGHVSSQRKKWDNHGMHNFFLKGNNTLDVAKWISPTSTQKKRLSKIIDGTPKTGGTDWRHPFNIAYSMTPKPDVIYFMTDGKCTNSQESVDIVKQNKYTPVNTIAFGLDPKHAEPLAVIAKETKGEFKSYSMEEIKKMAADLGLGKK